MTFSVRLAGAHHAERREDRDGDGEADDERLAERAEEQQHDDHGEAGTEQRGVAHRADGAADERRLVLDGRVLDVAPV
jgi:hypothetical protein